MNIWDLAAQWSARRWLRRLRSRLESGRAAVERDPGLAAALDQHVQAIRIHLDAERTARAALTPTPYVVLLAIYTDDIYREAVKSGWEPPSTWTADDGVSLRLLACCSLSTPSRLRTGRAP
ncbi:DUF6401 family natural product biosynthesis protein [Actinocrispum sp. NPDC049592]|uniref:DUF6401 family natural product biosynthesis protein n=1 Tax=Actinocrispum sp. NPDC049592 TaxID=3154835 RepID=UPI0034135027